MNSKTFNLRLLFTLVLALSTAGLLHAQTNSWIAPAGDKWETATNWSLGLAPTNTQSVLVTNLNSKVVTVDSTTSGSFSNTMTVNELSVAAPDGSTNTLAISGTGTNVPLTVLASLLVSNGGVLLISNAVVNVAGITNGTFSLGGDVIIQNGRLLVSNVLACGEDPGSPGTITVSGGTGSFSGTLCVGLNTNATGNVWVTGGQLMLTNGPATVGFYSTGQMTVSSSSTLTSDWPVIVGLGAGSQGSVTLDSSTWIAAGHLVVGQDFGANGTVSITGGQLTQTNVFLTLIGSAGSGQVVWSNSTISVGAVEIGADRGSQGTLSVAGGSNLIQGILSVGHGLGATGAVWMTGGQLIATNWPTWIAPWGYGVVTVSNGDWLGNSMLLGMHSVTATNFSTYVITGEVSHGFVNVNGGTMTLLSKLVIGNCTSGGVGVVNVTSGSLFVTNAAHTAFIDVRNGQLNLDGGTLVVDRLFVTNSCGSFQHNGGTLVLGPNSDADGDGMSDIWEQAYGLDFLNPADANVDSDADGFSNVQEFQADTNPTNSASALRIISILPDGDNIWIKWSVVSNKTYVVQAATNAFATDYTSLTTVTVAYSFLTNLSYWDGLAGSFSQRFYRIKLINTP